MKITGSRVHGLGVLISICFAAMASGRPVTFQLDMNQQVAISAFNPLGDTVEARGDFNGWSGGWALTNDPASIQPYIYRNTFNVTNQPGTPLGYKFVQVSGGSVTWENNLTPATSGNRTFILGTSGQSLPIIYFNDLSPASGVATHNLTFQVDMSVQVNENNFYPQYGDTVEVRGTFFQSPNQ